MTRAIDEVNDTRTQADAIRRLNDSIIESAAEQTRRPLSASLSFRHLKNKIKTRLLRLSYWIAYYAAAPAVYSRQPFVRYPYMSPPSELMELAKQLLSVKTSGAVVEVGCNQGWTTC